MADHLKPHDKHLPLEHEVRLEKVKKLRQLGIDPWPAKQPSIDATCQQVLTEFEQGMHDQPYMLAGRLKAIRLHGKSAFATIQDSTGTIQIYLKSNVIGQENFHIFEQLIDIGDIVWVQGTSFRTKMGEVTLNVTKYLLLSKSLYPLPEKFHGLSDIETRYRQRYLDLITNPESKQRFIKRSLLVQDLRNYLDNHGYLEVETPMLHPIAGGAAARPFVTHHNALDQEFFLRIAPELYLKRLIVGGFDKVYELNRNFRNEGISTRHNPEFTMLEFYTAFKDYHYIMNFVENMLKYIVNDICGSLQIPFGSHIIDFQKPFVRISMKDAIKQQLNISDEQLEGNNLNTLLKKHTISIDNDLADGHKIAALFEMIVEPLLVNPTFITDFPIEISPLAKRDAQNPAVAARFELFIANMEISNGFNELNDPLEQAERFLDQLKLKHDEAHQFDEDFITALEHAMPPTVGVGIGIDRLTMILTNTTSIKDVILFPTLKKKVS